MFSIDRYKESYLIQASNFKISKLVNDSSEAASTQIASLSFSLEFENDS